MTSVGHIKISTHHKQLEAILVLLNKTSAGLHSHALFTLSPIRNKLLRSIAGKNRFFLDLHNKVRTSCGKFSLWLPNTHQRELSLIPRKLRQQWGHKFGSSPVLLFLWSSEMKMQIKLLKFPKPAPGGTNTIVHVMDSKHKLKNAACSFRQ